MDTGVYFFVRDTYYQHDLIVLAEGFRELGVPFYGSLPYWRESPDSQATLIPHHPGVRPEDCAVVVVPSWWFYGFNFLEVGSKLPIPPEVLVPKARRGYRTVYLDHNDGCVTVSSHPDMCAFDWIFRNKINRRARLPCPMAPTADALQQRVIEYTAGAESYEDRSPVIYVNYGASHPYPHSSRRAAVERLHPLLDGVFATYQPPFADVGEKGPEDPVENLLWSQTYGRHSKTYYERLKQSQASSAFCGELVPGMPFDASVYGTGGNKARLKEWLWRAADAAVRSDPRMISFDSFRFWESLAAGCLTFQCDLAYYGCVYPVMPENRRHYIGVRFDEIGKTVDFLHANRNNLGEIADEGRRWALEHYSPRAMATRFLETLDVD